MSCNKTKRQKSMIYDKKSDILPRLCFGLIYPPQKKRKPRDAEAFAFLSVLDAYDEVFACHAKVFARLYKSLGGKGEHCSPAKNHKETFSLIALLNDQKRGKSHQRELSPLFEISPRVHELVARAMRGKCVRYGAERKSMVLPLLVISNIPRVRTYHTR